MTTPIPVNQCDFTLGEIARATGGVIAPGASAALPVRGVSIDSRTIEPGALFVPLKGADRDGHEFVAAAIRRGAAAVLLERGEAPTPSVKVGDTLTALGDLARFHLERERAIRAIPSIAILGSAGKTTTKEITAALAGALFGPILSTPGNLNNLIGVPMTLFTLTRNQRALVIECGTNTRGEIARLGAILKPDTALVLNVDIEHSEGLGTIEEIADEETAIFGATTRIAVAPAGDPRILTRIPARLRSILFGESAAAQVRLTHRAVTSQGRATIVIELAPAMTESGVAPRIEAQLNLAGAQSALNAAAAIAGVAAIWPQVLGAAELRAIEGALATVRAVPGRLSTLTIRGIFIIDDSYNSNPRSARAALEAASEAARDLGARLVVAMGDMLELGPLGPAAHVELIHAIARARPAAVVAVGTQLAAACRSAGEPEIAARAELAADSDEAARIVGRVVRPGDVLLVKGSRGIRMERVIEALQT
jgi:UDP-N-acetylmuramoyl-tripeptide--D-alanyl-D-alanine ligase